jgi:hypothetical protein
MPVGEHDVLPPHFSMPVPMTIDTKQIPTDTVSQSFLFTTKRFNPGDHSLKISAAILLIDDYSLFLVEPALRLITN